jgi:lysophospholipase L1-like esterase
MPNRPKMRILLVLPVFAGLLVAACSQLTGGGGSSSPTAPTGPPAAGSNIVYSAVGASDVIGFGSTTPCIPFDDCNGTGYVWVAARQLRSQGYTVTVNSLGIPTAVISRTFQDLGAQNGRTIAGNLLEGEMPFVSRSASVVTIFIGANDVNTITAALGNGAGASDPNGYIDQKVATFASDMTTLLNGIRARATSARIIVINLPNLAGLPYLASASLGQKQAAQRASVRMTTTVINTLPSVTVIDLMCDSRFYQGSTYSSDGFHPNDAGYAILGAEVVSAITSSSYPAPRASCSQMIMY